MQPRYLYPAVTVLGLIRDGILKRRRSFAGDARACIAALQPPLRMLGAECIPPEGSYAITPNHYSRLGYASQWTALAISASVPREVHWVMTAELTFPGRWYAAIAAQASRVILGRLAQVYGFSTMPPMPPRSGDVAARAAAVMAILRHVARTPEVVIGLAPEGGDQPGGQLSMPPSGLGRFCVLLARAGLRFVPVGVYECEGRLTMRFGAPYELPLPSRMNTHLADRLAAAYIMQQIAELLPRSLRGEFCRKQSNEL